MTGPALSHPASDELTYARILLPAVAKYADRIAFRGVDEAGQPADKLGDHVDRSLRIASGLPALLKIRRDDRIAVISANSRLYANVWHAALLGGGIINPINTRLGDLEIAHILRHSESAVVIADRQNVGRVLGMRKDGAIPASIVVVGIENDLEGVDLSLGEIIAAGHADGPAKTNEDSTAVLMYTGGTTGLPKGVVLSQRAVVLNIYRGALSQGYLRTPVNQLVFAPMFHIGICSALSMCAGGGTCSIMSRFDVGAILQAIDRFGITHIGMPPSAVGMMLAHPLFDPDRLRTLKALAYGSSPMPLGFIHQLQERLPQVALSQSYGMTEAAPLLTFLAPEDHFDERTRRSVGRALPGIDITIQDAAGRICEPDVVGEVCARSGSLMTEYWRNPDATEAALRDGWYRTQDAGYMTADGYLFLVDRLKDMIVSGGENVYSVEVESAISTHPAVAQVAVIGIPSETWGEAVHAIVVLHAGAGEATEQAIMDHCRLSIASYKVPKTVEFRNDPLPMSGAMKALKDKLREPYWKGRDARVA